MLAGAAAALGPWTLSAQIPVQARAPNDSVLARAADVMTPEAVTQHLGVLVSDSMTGRAAASPALLRTAHYVAEQFTRAGLQAGVSGWLQDYPVVYNRMTLDYDASRLYCSATTPRAGNPDTVDAAMTFTQGVYLAVDTVLESERTRDISSDSVVVVSGRQTPATIADAGVHGRVVLYLPAPGTDSATQQRIVRQLYNDNLVLVLSRADSATFARRQQTAASRAFLAVDPTDAEQAPGGIHHWAVYASPDRMRACLERAGMKLDQRQADTLPAVRALPGLSLWSSARTGDLSPERTNGVNVVGVLRGTGFPSDVVGGPLWERAIVISAHMDRAGATENSAGLSMLLELARAFAQLEPSERPRCTIVFLATSGIAQWWGSGAWLGTVPANLAVMADLNLDLAGRSAGDSLWVDGGRDVQWPVPLQWLTGRYPELQLTLVDGGSSVQPRSDHFAFVQHSIPSLYFYDEAADAAPASGTPRPPAFDADRIARAAKLVFHLGYDLGNEARQLTWTDEGRRNLLLMFDRP